MNTESIKRMVKGLGKADFDRLVSILVKKVFNLMPLNVDGKGDCGMDVILCEGGEKKEIAIQVTVQQQHWDNKVLEDAAKVSKLLGRWRFYAFVNVECGETNKREVCDAIFEQYGMAAQLFTVREIASYIEECDLSDELIAIIAPDWSRTKGLTIDQEERLLHSFFVMSEDGNDVQNEIYDTTILFVVCNKGDLTREQIKEDVVLQLKLSEGETEKVERRIDSLLSRDLLLKESDVLRLSARAERELGLAAASYTQDFGAFAKLCETVVREHGGAMSQAQIEEMAGCVARCYLKNSLERLKKNSLELRASGFDRSLNEAEDRILELLVECGIGKRNACEALRQKIVNKTCGCELVRKLMSAVVYACLRDVSNAKAAMVLNVTSWEDVKVFVDASVAIPYLASKEYGGSDHRHSRGALSILGACAKLRVQRYLPKEYLNECAAHLITAYDRYFVPYSDFDKELTHSCNGYVAHFYQRKQQGDTRLPKSLGEYIGRLSRAAIDNTLDFKARVAAVEDDLSAYFQEYNISIWNVDAIDEETEKCISVALSQALKNRGRSRGDWQIRHDVQVAGKIARRTLGREFGKILLTWDSVLTETVEKMNFDYWSINPIDASDIIQARCRLPDSDYLSLGLSMAKTRIRREDVAGRFVDRMLELCGDKLLNMQYRQRINGLKRQIISRCMNYDDNVIDEQLDKELFDYDPELREVRLNSTEES